MSHVVTLENSDVEIAVTPESCAAVAQLLGVPVTDEVIGDALDGLDISYTMRIGKGGGVSLVDLGYVDEDASSEAWEDLFDALAPFIDEGSTMEFEYGGGTERWEWLFIDGKRKEVQGHWCYREDCCQ